MEIGGKVALVTGGGTGIGRATALLLAARGVDVAVNYSRSKDDAEATAAEVRKLGRRALALRADVARDDEVRRMVADTVRELGALHILVNNAGWTEFVDFKDLDKLNDDVWDRTLAVNVKGPFYCIRAAAPHMQAAGGVVVNVSSLAGSIGRGSSIPYCASKAGLNLLTRMMARLLAPAVRVNAVAPGVVTTRWVANQTAFVRGAQMQTPMRRVAGPEDVAQAILALIESNDFVTGQILPVDGGLSA
jgi:3-oxoacyl-[acyl-carrier protein] reductase